MVRFELNVDTKIGEKVVGRDHVCIKKLKRVLKVNNNSASSPMDLYM